MSACRERNVTKPVRTPLAATDVRAGKGLHWILQIDKLAMVHDLYSIWCVMC